MASSPGLTEGSQRALVIDLVSDEWRGRALGAFQAVTGIALLPASVIFGAIYQNDGAKPAFILGAARAGRDPRTHFARFEPGREGYLTPM